MGKLANISGKNLWDGSQLQEITWFQDKIDTVEDLLNPRGGKSSDSVRELVFVNRGELRDNDDAPLGKICFSLVEKHVPRALRSLGVGGQAADDDCVETAAVVDVVLNDDVGVEETGT